MADFQSTISELEIADFRSACQLQNGPQRLDDAVGVVVVQHAIDAILTLALAGLSAEQVASVRVTVLGFAFRRHGETLLNPFVSFLLRHIELDAREVHKIDNFTAPARAGWPKERGTIESDPNPFH